MKYFRLLILVLCGCRTLDKKIIERSAAPVSPIVSFSNSSEAVMLPLVMIVPINQNTIEIACTESYFTNNSWSAWVSQDMQTWWEFPQSCPENRRICFIPGASNTFVRLVGVPL
jgi:hypothetical protein